MCKVVIHKSSYFDTFLSFYTKTNLCIMLLLYSLLFDCHSQIGCCYILFIRPAFSNCLLLYSFLFDRNSKIGCCYSVCYSTVILKLIVAIFFLFDWHFKIGCCYIVCYSTAIAKLVVSILFAIRPAFSNWLLYLLHLSSFKCLLHYVA